MPVQLNNKLVLSPDEKRQIEDDVGFILDSFEIKRPPIPVIYIVKQTFPQSKIYFSHRMPEHLKGCAIKGQGKHDIFINPKYGQPSQRYTLGHELGHLLSDESGMSFDGPQTILTPELKFKERRADYFSACLLMPEWLVYSAWEFFHDIGTMANVFDVSIQAMIIRLKWLGAIDPGYAEQLLEAYKD